MLDRWMCLDEDVTIVLFFFNVVHCRAFQGKETPAVERSIHQVSRVLQDGKQIQTKNMGSSLFI